MSDFATQPPEKRSADPGLSVQPLNPGVILSLAGLGAAAAATIASFFGVGLLLIEQPGGGIRPSASPGSFVGIPSEAPMKPVAAALEAQKSTMLHGVVTPPRQSSLVPQLSPPKDNTAAGVSMSSLPSRPTTASAAAIPGQGPAPDPAKSGRALNNAPSVHTFAASLNPPADRKTNDFLALTATAPEARPIPRTPGKGSSVDGTSVDRATSSLPSAEDIKVLVARGDAALRARDPISARLFYQRVYEAGERRGALGMAASYDPLILQRFHIPAQQSNLAETFEWYIRARELDNSAATGVHNPTEPGNDPY